MSRFKLIREITSAELAGEWDALAAQRHEQIITGTDVTFHYVMSPLVKGLIGEDFFENLVDIGSGTGELTKKLAPQFNRILCVEPSVESLNISMEMLQQFHQAEFYNCEFESADLGCLKGSTIYLASMVLSATANLDAFVRSLAKLCKGDSAFIATIPHPCFWPRYWGYEAESWFSYERELFIQAPFRTSLSKTSVSTTHVHRPIEMYIDAFKTHGFVLQELKEPIPNKEVQNLYPSEWEYPRFLGFKWIKAGAQS